MKLSIVTSLYKSERYLDTFLDELLISLRDLSISDFEIIFVLDGITDNSKQVLLSKKINIPQIKIIELSRNFGHHYAVSAGLNISQGDFIFLIDCDLEISPKILIKFMTVMDETKVDVVYGIQKSRKGHFVERELGRVFWKIFNLLSETKIPLNVVTERLMTKQYVDELVSLGDKNIFLGGMMYWIGFNQTSIEVLKKQREEKSTYSFSKRLNLLIEAITSFSERPLKLILKSGIYITFLSILAIIYLTTKKILFPDTILVGYTSIIITILLSLGILTASIGIVGIYISRIFKQTQNRPNYIIKKIY